MQKKRVHVVTDVWGHHHQVIERRKTPYGFTILIGRPYPTPAVRGGAGGTGVIVTPALSAHVRRHIQHPYKHSLPISKTALIRVRRLLRLDHRVWDDNYIDWWLDRLDDLAALTSPEFMRRHGAKAWTRTGGLSEARVGQMRAALLGYRQRPKRWAEAPAVQALLRSDLPAGVVGERLGLVPNSVRRMRAAMRQGGAAGSRWTSPRTGK